MFFETEDFNAENIAVFDLNWDSNVGESAFRTYHALSLRIEGDATFFSGDEQISVQSGDIIFVPQGHRYRLKAGKERLVVIHFNSDKEIGNKIKKFTPKSEARFKQYFEQICNVWLQKKAGYTHECKYLLHRIIAMMEKEQVTEVQDSKSAEMKRVAEYIHDNFTDRELTVSRLAKLCNMSETYFRRLFYESFSVLPLEYINELRLEYALELLQTGYYTVAEAADKCGFSSVYYFSAFIKKQTGRSPAEYLKTNG